MKLRSNQIEHYHTTLNEAAIRHVPVLIRRGQFQVEMMSACSSIRRSPSLSQPLQWWRYRRCCHFASITPLRVSVATAQYHYHAEDEKSKHKKYNAAVNLQLQRHISINNKPLLNVLSKEAATAPIDYPTSKRFYALPPAIGIHLAIGSVYVYSMWTPGMSKALGKREICEQIQRLFMCSLLTVCTNYI